VSIGDYIGVGGSAVIFGMTMLVVLQEYLAPWLVHVLRRTDRSHCDKRSAPEIRGTIVSFGKGSK